MTSEEAIEIAPGSRDSYWAALAVWTVWTVLMLAGAVYDLSQSKKAIAAVSIACAFIGMLGVIQATQRLFFPQRAAIRARRLSTSRAFAAVITTVRNVSLLSFVLWVLYMVGFLARSTANDSRFIFLLALFQMFHWLLLDASGEGRPVEKIHRDFLSVENTKPLQSHHWGESSGASHATSLR